MALKDNVEPGNGRDDIDRIVDALLANPDQISDIKTLLRHKLSAPETVHVARPAAVPVPADLAEDVDDFWDNVPV